MPDIASSTCKGLQQAISQLAGVSFDSQTGLFILELRLASTCFHAFMSWETIGTAPRGLSYCESSQVFE